MDTLCRFVLQASDLGSFPFSQNFRFEISETLRVKWKGFFHAGGGPRFQFQTCNVNTDGAGSQQNGRKQFHFFLTLWAIMTKN